jgi:hypothetical protein
VRSSRRRTDRLPPSCASEQLRTAAMSSGNSSGGGRVRMRIRRPSGVRALCRLSARAQCMKQAHCCCAPTIGMYQA